MSDWGRRLSYWRRLLFRVYLIWYSLTDLCMRSTANRTMFKKLPYYNGRQQMVSPQKHRSSWRSEQASYARRGDGLAKVLVLILQCAIVNLAFSTGSTLPWLTQLYRGTRRRRDVWHRQQQLDRDEHCGGKLSTWRQLGGEVEGYLSSCHTQASYLPLMDGEYKSPKKSMEDNNDAIGRP